MRLGSLCSGAGMFDEAVSSLLGCEIAWHAESDPAASAVLAHRYPGVPNHGALERVYWSSVEPVDVVCGGWPCQPASSAGRRKGRDDERWLWPEVERCLRVLRPRLFLGENVPGLRSVDDGLGFNEVLSGLARCGFDVEWGSLTASSVGACHRRERVFVLAVAVDADRDRRQGFPQQDSGTLGGFAGALGYDAGLAVGAAEGLTLLPTPRANADRASRSLLPTPRARDGKAGGGGEHGEGSPDLRTALGVAVSLSELPPEDGRARTALPEGALSRWGDYAPAIARHEAVFGRVAPAPLEPAPKGGVRLSAPFVEWMMTWPAGWVTGVVGRSAALRICGNGVVPLQAWTAFRALLARLDERGGLRSAVGLAG